MTRGGRWFLQTLLVVCTSWCGARVAHASCVLSLPSELEILPADGAVAPSDIENLYVYYPDVDPTLTVVTASGSYPVVDKLARLPTGLQPGDVFEYTIVGEIDPIGLAADAGTHKEYGPFSFTVGDAPAPDVSTPTGSLHFVDGTACGSATRSTPACEPDAVRHVVDGCYDTGIAMYYVMDVARRPNTALLRVDTAAGVGAEGAFFSFGCTRFMDVPTAVDHNGDTMICRGQACITVTPYDQALRLQPERATTVCETAQAPVTSDAGSADAEKAASGGGCGVARSTKTNGAWILSLLLVSLGRRFRRYPCQLRAAHDSK